MPKMIAVNRKAHHEYFLLDRYEAGIVLSGTEIKSVREGRVQLKDAYISFMNHEAFIKEMHISPYTFGNRFNHDETRIRKLLLHKEEIKKLSEKVNIKGFTVVPVSIYLEKGLAKMEIALAKGKNLHDKRETEKERDAKREIQKALKHSFE
ncbi:MAG: SsrA-binding protein SmpB [Erysipelotrichaceae bacterium]|nr:SsrA-binding protein SmpB [Erysipelotrichaceae bacterium]MCI9525095.1 SsrA-binding protein SmpB [Erysipelotrichaceae bacterium]